MFKRRKKHGFWKNLKEALWPSMGWVRAAQYYRHRIFRTGDSVYKITAGLACGVAVAFSPFLGTHLIQTVFLTWLVRGNYIAGIVGSAFGNPWTYPAIFWGGYELGVNIFGLWGLHDMIALEGPVTLGDLFDHPLHLLLPLSVGGYLCALAAWPLAYILLYIPVRLLRHAYLTQRAHRRHQRQGATA